MSPSGDLSAEAVMQRGGTGGSHDRESVVATRIADASDRPAVLQTSFVLQAFCPVSYGFCDIISTPYWQASRCRLFATTVEFEIVIPRLLVIVTPLP